MLRGLSARGTVSQGRGIGSVEGVGFELGGWGRLTTKVTLPGPLHPPSCSPLQRDASQIPPSSCSLQCIPPGPSCPTRAQRTPSCAPPLDMPPTKGTTIHTQRSNRKPGHQPDLRPPLPLTPFDAGAGGAPSTSAEVTDSAPSQLGDSTPAWGRGRFLVMVEPAPFLLLCRHCPPPLVAPTLEPMVGP